MIIPCIDLMGGKAVQLVQGKEKRLEIPDPFLVLEKFAPYPEIQVIDLDAAMGGVSQTELVAELCSRKPCRVGGGIRSVERACEVVSGGARKFIVGSSAFTAEGVNDEFLARLTGKIPTEKIIIAVDCLGNQVAVKGWKKFLPLTPEQVFSKLEPYCSEFLCTYIDQEGKLQGTDLGWFEKLRRLTKHTITAAGGISTEEEIRALDDLGMHAALGMQIYRRYFPELFSAV